MDYNFIAQRYARASYDYARENDVVKKWSIMLYYLSHYVRDSLIKKGLNSPFFTQYDFAEEFIKVFGHYLDADFFNFINILSCNKRLELAPNIYNLFKKYDHDSRNIKNVFIKTSFDLSSNYIAKIQSKVEEKYYCKANIIIEKDYDIIGGLIINIDDLVIDASILGGLKQLESFMNINV